MSGDAPTTRHERRDIPAALVAAAAGGLLVALVVIAGVVALYQRALVGDRPTARGRVSSEALENLEDSRHWARTDEGRRLAEELTSELDRPHWIDRERGVVAIPVDRAVTLVLAEGLQVRTAPGPEETP